MTPKEILDSFAIIAHELGRICESSNNITPCSLRNGSEVHVFGGLALLAEAAESEIKTRDDYGSSNVFESSFTYEGVRFFQIGDTAEESYGVK